MYHLTPVPADSNTVLLYVTYLHNARLSSSTVSVYLSAIRSLHVLAGLPEPDIRTPQVKLALKAISALGPFSS